jgi:adenosylcobinamide-GDP ribazoletransferase
VTTRASLFSAFGEAVRFLTVLPWPGPATPDAPSLAHGAAAFPAVGLLIGAASVATGLMAEEVFGSPLHIVAALGSSAVVTGALHLDGLADSADALFSWRSREQKLAILHDSRIGTMGALALFFVLATKLGALLTLGTWWWRAALVGPVWGRWAALYGVVWFPAARPDGLGAAARSHVRQRDFVAATLLALAISAIAAPVAGALAGLLVFAATHWFARAMTRSLGGLTGDTCGALGEIAEVATLVGLAALKHHAWIE